MAIWIKSSFHFRAQNLPLPYTIYSLDSFKLTHHSVLCGQMVTYWYVHVKCEGLRFSFIGGLLFSLCSIFVTISCTSFAISLKRKGFTTVTFLFSFVTLTQHMSNRWFVRFINVWIFWMGKEPGQDKTWLPTAVNYVCLHQKLQIARTWLGNVFELDLDWNKYIV